MKQVTLVFVIDKEQGQNLVFLLQILISCQI